MEDNIKAQAISGEEKREKAKRLLSVCEKTDETFKEAVSLLFDARREGDVEAVYILAELMFHGYIKLIAGNSFDVALSMMCTAANKGCIEARRRLNYLCEERYSSNSNIIETKNREPGPLVDFEGKPIKINRQGLLTPIDAVLTYENDKNILTLGVNITIICNEVEDEDRYFDAVCNGILDWEGEYEVFGGQKLEVRINLTAENRLFDTVFVIPVTQEIETDLKSFGKFITGKRKEQYLDLVGNETSFFSGAKEWTVHSRKMIVLKSKSGKFNEYEKIRNVTKHEFGHALGLGDLYESAECSLEGVEKGTFFELDCYALGKKNYNLVMCDHYGPISNNDIEMVILAFKENKWQSYQPDKLKGKVSAALGRGN